MRRLILGVALLAIIVGVGTYPLLFLAAYADPARLALLMCLYLVALLRLVVTPRG